MTSSYRALERLPPEVFENLVLEEENGSAIESDSSLFLSFCPSLVLRQRLCNKLKSFSQRRVNSRLKQRSIHNVGDFLTIPEIDLVNGLDPLLTFGTQRQAIDTRPRVLPLCAEFIKARLSHFLVRIDSFQRNVENSDGVFVPFVLPNR